jgi:hypothetical protein
MIKWKKLWNESIVAQFEALRKITYRNNGNSRKTALMIASPEREIRSET